MTNELAVSAMSDYLVSQGIQKGSDEYKDLMTAGSTLLGTAVGALAGNANTGANVATNATTYNKLLHWDQQADIAQLAKIEGKGSVEELTAVLCVMQNCNVDGTSGVNADGQKLYDAGIKLKAENEDQYNELAKQLRDAGLTSGEYTYTLMDSAADKVGAGVQSIKDTIDKIPGLVAVTPVIISTQLQQAKDALVQLDKDLAPQNSQPQGMMPDNYGDHPNQPPTANAVVTPPACMPGEVCMWAPNVLPVVTPSNLTFNSGSNENTQDSTPSPALPDNPYSPSSVDARIKPTYQANPAHDTSTPLYNPSKTPEPTDAQSAYESGAVRGNMYTWYAEG